MKHLNNNGRRIVTIEFEINGITYHKGQIVQFAYDDKQKLYMVGVNLPKSKRFNFNYVFVENTIDIPDHLYKLNDTVVYMGHLYKFKSYKSSYTAVLQKMSSDQIIFAAIDKLITPTKYYYIDYRGDVCVGYKEHDEQAYMFTGIIGLRFENENDALNKSRELLKKI